METSSGTSAAGVISRTRLGPRSGDSYVTRDRARLTGNRIHPPIHQDLIAPRARAQGFVTNSDEDDGEEGEDQPGGGPDVPRLEDDAEVGGVPGEEHLQTRRGECPSSARMHKPPDRGRRKAQRGGGDGGRCPYAHAAHGRHIVASVAGHVHVAVAQHFVVRVVHGVVVCLSIEGVGVGEGREEAERRALKRKRN